MAGCRGIGFTITEDADLVTDRRIPEMPDPKAAIDQIRVSDGAAEVAVAFDDDADFVSLVDIEPALFDEKVIHHRIEVGIIRDVVDVTIKVVIHPARLKAEKITVIVPCFGFWWCHLSLVFACRT